MNFKRILCAALCLALMTSMAPAVPASSGESSGEASGEQTAVVSLTVGDWKFDRAKTDDGYTVTVTQFSGDPDQNGFVVVPKILGGGTVTAIGPTAFRNTQIRAILLPDSAQTVAEWAFYDCTALEYVTCASSALSVDEDAFQNSPAEVLTGGWTSTLTLEPPEAEQGFALLWEGDYYAPDGTELSVPESGAILRADAVGRVYVGGTTVTVESYDGSAVNPDADEPAAFAVDSALAEQYALTAEEIDMTFRALDAAEAEALNTAVAEGSFAAYASRLRFSEGFWLNGSLVAVDASVVCLDAATGDILAAADGSGDFSSLYANPLLDALGAKDSVSPYNYVAFRDTDDDGDIDVLFYAQRTLPSSGATVTLTGALVREGISGAASSELLAGKTGRPTLDGGYLSFENAVVEAGAGETISLASAEIATADDSVLGAVNAERSLLWADAGGVIDVDLLRGTSTSQGNWTKLRDENNSYAGQPMEVIMQWGMGAALYASQGGILTVGDPDGERGLVTACGDGANGVLATGVLDETQPSQIYVYNTDFELSGWNNHVVDTIYGGYVYLQDVTGVTGAPGSYIMNNGSTLANDFGDGTVEVRSFSGEAWGDSSAGIYVIGSGSVVAEDSSFFSHLNAAVMARGGSAVFTDTDLTGMVCYSGTGTYASFDGGTWTLRRDYAGDGYVYGAAAAEMANLWIDVTGGTTLLSYVMSSVGSTWADLYAEYADAIDAWGGKESFYSAVNAIADAYGYGEAYYAADEALLRGSMFDNTFYAIMRNGFQYTPGEDGLFSTEALADWSDVPYLGASDRSCFMVSLIHATGTLDVRGVTFVYDDSIGADYRYLSTGSGTVTLTDCVGAAGLVTDGAITFAGTDFEGSFAAGSKGLWDGAVEYTDATGARTCRNGNYTGAESAGASAVFTDGSVWTVTHESWLSSLTLAEDASVVGADGAAVTLYVDGVETPLLPGTYSGELHLTLS